MKKITKKSELMCPIQNWASLEACKDYADAVYFGVSELSLRANANAIQAKDMKRFTKQCHAYGVKAYLALNAVVFNADIKKAEALVRKAKAANVDAIIVWDPAIIDIARRLKMTFFISTQANISNWQTAEFYKRLGAKRVVLAREMTLEQIKELRKHTKVEVETFVHGAMCVAISGRCLMSAYLYETSANLGACAQPCRKAWTLTDSEGKQMEIEDNYLMSAKDLNMIEHVPELIEAGIDSFKIEGRRRDPRYIQITARCYREAIDAYFNKTWSKEKVAKWQEELTSVYNRGYFTGFYFGDPGRYGISYKGAENNASIKRKLVGQVVNFYAKIGVAEVHLNHNNLHQGDAAIIEGKNTFFEQPVESIEIEGKKVVEGVKGQLVAIKVKDKVRRNDLVFIISDK